MVPDEGHVTAPVKRSADQSNYWHFTYPCVPFGISIHFYSFLFMSIHFYPFLFISIHFLWCVTPKCPALTKKFDLHQHPYFFSWVSNNSVPYCFSEGHLAITILDISRILACHAHLTPPETSDNFQVHESMVDTKSSTLYVHLYIQ